MESRLIPNSLGNKVWRNNKGNLHREDGPAIITIDGSESWLYDGLLHREDGPAYISSNGTRVWYINNKKHREDGPAVINFLGHEKWYLNGNKYSEKQYKREMRKIKIDSLKKL